MCGKKNQLVGHCILGVTLRGKQGLWLVLKLVKNRCFGQKCHNFFITDPISVRPNVLVRVQSVVCCVIVSDQFNEHFVQGKLYKVALQNKLEFSKVCHFCYNSFSKRFQVVTLGGISLKTIKNIVYQFHIFIRYKFKVMIASSQGC